MFCSCFTEQKGVLTRRSPSLLLWSFLSFSSSLLQLDLLFTKRRNVRALKEVSWYFYKDWKTEASSSLKQEGSDNTRLSSFFALRCLWRKTIFIQYQLFSVILYINPVQDQRTNSVFCILQLLTTSLNCLRDWIQRPHKPAHRDFFTFKQ